MSRGDVTADRYRLQSTRPISLIRRSVESGEPVVKKVDQRSLGMTCDRQDVAVIEAHVDAPQVVQFGRESNIGDADQRVSRCL